MSDVDPSSSNRRQQPLVPFESFPVFNFPKFGERNSRELGGPVSFAPSQRTTTAGGSVQQRDQRRQKAASTYPQPSSQSNLRSRSGEPQYPRDGIFKAEGQRIYPSFNRGRNSYVQQVHNARSASNRRPFYPSQKVSHGPKSRSSSNNRNSLPNGFRDFHETFYGHKKRPVSHSHRQNDYAPVDNSLLGSGNFEVLSGGTFYDDDKGGHSNNRHPYDSFLDNGYPYNDGGNPYHQPHSNNYVDDFFSNFRDFSEFAVRRSDRGHREKERDDFFGGYASENTDKVVALSSSERKKLNYRNDPKRENVNDSRQGKSMDVAESSYTPDHPPRNIQEVMEQEEAQPSNQEISEQSIDEKDPMIAIF